MQLRFLSLLVVTVYLSAKAQVTQQDKLFEQFDGSRPGCAVGVVQDGKVLFAKGYGLADLEHNIPLSPADRWKS